MRQDRYRGGLDRRQKRGCVPLRLYRLGSIVRGCPSEDWRKVTLDDLIANKRASGRPKDIVDAMTLEKMREGKNG